jgi:hypothetical protein
MSEQRAVGLAHLVPPSLALGVIGLCKIDRDQPVLVAGQHRGRPVGQKIERQPFRILRLGGERQFQLQERVEEPVFRDLDRAPMNEISWQGQVWDRAVVAARRTELFVAVGRHQPVAHLVRRVGAIAVAPARRRQRRPLPCIPP